MRSFSDEKIPALFWEGIGRYFFFIYFIKADYLSGIGQKALIAELMPQKPLYVDFFPKIRKK